MPALPPVVGRSKVLKLSLRMTGMQCSGPVPDGLALYLPVHLYCSLHRFRIDSDDGVQRRSPKIVGFNPIEIQPCQLRAGHLTGGQRIADAGDRCLLQMKWDSRLLRPCQGCRDGQHREWQPHKLRNSRNFHRPAADVGLPQQTSTRANVHSSSIRLMTCGTSAASRYPALTSVSACSRARVRYCSFDV